MGRYGVAILSGVLLLGGVYAAPCVAGETSSAAGDTRAGEPSREEIVDIMMNVELLGDLELLEDLDLIRYHQLLMMSER